MDLTPCRLGPDDPALTEVLTLIQTAFTFMDGRIDPPSSMHRLSLDTVARHAANVEIWTIGTPIRACVFLTPKAHCMYLGKLAVAEDARKTGLARRLIHLAEERARALNLPRVELQTRVELAENQAAFVALGFQEIGRTAHAGYDHPTSITFSKQV